MNPGVKATLLNTALGLFAATTLACTDGFARKPATAQKEGVVSSDTPLAGIREIFSYIHEPANVVQIQVTSDKTLCMWQNLSGFQYTMQILREGPISELPAPIVANIGKVSFTRSNEKQENESRVIDDRVSRRQL